MKQVLQFILLSVIGLSLLSGCDKRESAELLNVADGFAPGPGNPLIEQYINSHNIDATRDPSGLYYQILDYGDSTHYITSLENIPTITYSRRLINDKLIDLSLAATDFNGRRLKDHIAGWQIGLRKVPKGGKILLIIPPSLGFGNIAVDKIPPNSILVCELTLVDFR